MYPQISITTPSFNQGQFIEQTIQSVLIDNYPHLEYMVIDGGSTDGTVDIIKKYEKNITYWESQPDNGQSHAVNKGLARATGDIVNWLNSDDYYEPGALHHVADIFNDNTVMGYSGISRIFGGQNEYFSTGTDIYPGNLHKTIGWARIDQPETFFRRLVFYEIGFLNENLHYVMDRDLWIRYLCRFGLKGFVKDKKLLVHFRLHDTSKTLQQREQFNAEQRNLFYTYCCLRELTDFALILKDLFEVKELPLKYYDSSLPAEDWKQVMNYYLLREGLEAYALNEFEQARKILRHVNGKWLQKADYDEMFRVQMRLKLLPKSLKIFWNRIRS
jgi:glycosyltransferase involved in cell wall biosynthesis